MKNKALAERLPHEVEFARRVVELRELLGYGHRGRRALARDLGASPSKVYFWENGAMPREPTEFFDCIRRLVAKHPGLGDVEELALWVLRGGARPTCFTARSALVTTLDEPPPPTRPAGGRKPIILDLVEASRAKLREAAQADASDDVRERVEGVVVELNELLRMLRRDQPEQITGEDAWNLGGSCRSATILALEVRAAA